MILQVPLRDKLKDIVFQEPLTEATMTKRKELLFVASFAILIKVYDLKINKTPWLEIEVPQNTPNILHGAISVALIYFFTVFVFYAWSDLKRWYHAGGTLYLNAFFDQVLHGREHLFAISQHREKIPVAETDNEQLKEIRNTIQEATSFFHQIEQKKEEIETEHRFMTFGLWFRLAILDLGVPVMLGLLALWKISPASIPFVRAIFQ